MNPDVLERRYGPRGMTVRPLLTRADGASKGLGRLRGYGAVFKSDSEEMMDARGRRFVEQIVPGAFAKTLSSKRGVAFLWGHDPDRPMAKTPHTMQLREDSQGLLVDVQLPDTSDGRDLRTLVADGTIDAMSFGFHVIQERWEQRDGKPDLRNLLEIELHEVSAVLWPAYPATKLALASAPIAGAKQLTDDDYALGLFGN